MTEKTLNKKKAVKIKWDVDNEKDLEALPTEIEIPDGMEDEEVSDYLSEVAGYCHKGFCLSQEEKKTDVQRIGVAQRIKYQKSSDRDTPKEPINVYNNFGEGCLSCPCCKKPIVNIWTKASYMPNYCHYCGQHLLWKNEKIK